MCDTSCHARDWRHVECRTWPVVRGREAFSWGSAAILTRLPAVVSAPFLRPPVHPRPRLPASRSGRRALSASGCLNVEPSRPMPVTPSEAEGHATALPAQLRPLLAVCAGGVRPQEQGTLSLRGGGTASSPDRPGAAVCGGAAPGRPASAPGASLSFTSQLPRRMKASSAAGELLLLFICLPKSWLHCFHYFLTVYNRPVTSSQSFVVNTVKFTTE